MNDNTRTIEAPEIQTTENGGIPFESAIIPRSFWLGGLQIVVNYDVDLYKSKKIVGEAHYPSQSIAIDPSIRKPPEKTSGVRLEFRTFEEQEPHKMSHLHSTYLQPTLFPRHHFSQFPSITSSLKNAVPLFHTQKRPNLTQLIISSHVAKQLKSKFPNVRKWVNYLLLYKTTLKIPRFSGNAALGFQVSKFTQPNYLPKTTPLNPHKNTRKTASTPS